jgi:hypothetical protein
MRRVALKSEQKSKRSAADHGESAEQNNLNLLAVRRALDAVLEWHGLKTDKTGAPAIGHLLQVAGLAIKYRPGDTRIAAGALLHDVLEDVRYVDYGQLVVQFGDEVAKIVRDCSDSLDGARDSNDWCQRKLNYLAKLSTKEDGARFVSLCDKVANARSLELDLKASGAPRAFFAIHGFNETRPAIQLWYYSELARLFREHPPAGAARLVTELERAVASMGEILGVSAQACEPRSSIAVAEA